MVQKEALTEMEEAKGEADFRLKCTILQADIDLTTTFDSNKVL